MAATGTVRFAVVGEAPGYTEDQKGEPFIGPSGQFLRYQMGLCGLNPDKAAYFNTVSCWPHDSDGHTRPPSEDERVACRHNLLDQMDAAKVRYALLVGGTAMNAWHPEFGITQVHGYTYRWGKRTVMPIYHPAAILRQKSRILAFRYDLKTWAAVLDGTITEEEARSPVCSVCQSMPVTYDSDWVPWCEQHALVG